MSLGKFQGIVVTLMIIGVLVGATMLTLVSFRDSIGDSECSGRSDGYTTYQSPNACKNATGALIYPSQSLNGSNQWVTAGTNLSSKAPTDFVSL